MNDKLIDEMYEMADRYNGRIKELLILAVAEIKHQDRTIQKLLQKDSEEKDILDTINEHHHKRKNAFIIPK